MASPESIRLIASLALHTSCNVRRAVSALRQSEAGWGKTEALSCSVTSASRRIWTGHPHRLPGQGLSTHKAGDLAECQGWRGPTIAKGAAFVNEDDELFLLVSTTPQLRHTQVEQPSVRC